MSSTFNLDVTIYASSELEAEHYRQSCGVASSSVKVVGVPRHSNQWIRRLREYYAGQSTEQTGHIFLASRPLSKVNFSPANKMAALQAVRTVADELGCKIVVRLHPAETKDDRFIIDAALGHVNIGKTWSYSALPAMVAADGALFAVTLFSSVAVDMLAIDVPVIELFDFSNFTSSPSLVPGPDGSQTSIYRRAGLVLAAANLAELETEAQAILRDRHAVLSDLKSAYARTYANPEEAVAMIVGEITKALGCTPKVA